MRHFSFSPPCDQLKRPCGVRDVYLFVPSVLFRVPSVEIVRTVFLASECIHSLFLYIHVMQYDNSCYSSCIAPFSLFISHVNILFFFFFSFFANVVTEGKGVWPRPSCKYLSNLGVELKAGLDDGRHNFNARYRCGGNALVGVWNVGHQYAKPTYCTCESNQHLQQGLTGENAISIRFFLIFTAIRSRFDRWTLVSSESHAQTLTHT